MELFNHAHRKLNSHVINLQLLSKIDIPYDKPIYIAKKTPEHFLALKQIQRNVSRLFGVKQSNRSAIVGQVKMLLADGFPKFVLRVDFKDFYESIPHRRLFEIINGNNLLTPFSRKIIKQVLSNYKEKSGTEIGIPRGIGISAYLAELYMRDIDEDIKSLKGVTYYARYVDDIIIIYLPAINGQSSVDSSELLNRFEKKYNLIINEDKTETFDLSSGTKTDSLDYLGYRLYYGHKTVKTALTEKKVGKYKQRIDLVFDAYRNFSKVNEKKARKLLIKRIRFLTGNTRLANNKKNILVGIFYSNDQLTEKSDLKKIDKHLKARIKTHIHLNQVKERLKQYSFYDGFETKRFSPFKTQDLSEIMSLWKKG